MNKMLIIVGIIFLVCMIVGYVRGFIKIIASLAATLATIVLVVFLTPYVSGTLLKVLPMERIMQEKCTEILLGDSTEDVEEGEEAAIPEEVEKSRELQIFLIENAELPEFFQQLLLENNNDEIYEMLGVTTFSEYVGKYLAKLIADILGFLLTFLAVTIVVRTILYTIGIISDLPVIGGLNRLAGGVLGLGTGLIVVWIVFIVLTIMYDSEIGKTCLQEIAENDFLTNLYNNNILMNYVTKFRG